MAKKEYRDTVTIGIKCNQAAADAILPLLKELRHMGNAGCSRGIKIEEYDGESNFGFDGDGPDRIESIELDGKLMKAKMIRASCGDELEAKLKKEGMYDEDDDDEDKEKKKVTKTLARASDLCKTKYTRRWKGKDGKWDYEYGKQSARKRGGSTKKFSVLAVVREYADLLGDVLYGGSSGADIHKEIDEKYGAGSYPKVIARFRTWQGEKPHMEEDMEKSNTMLVLIPGELTKAAKLSQVGAKHPAGLSGVSGNTKSSIPYTGHAERMKLAKMAAARMLAPTPEDEGEYADNAVVDRKGRVPGEKAPHTGYSTGVSGMGSQAHEMFGKVTVVVKPSQLGTSPPESATKYTPVKNVRKPGK